MKLFFLILSLVIVRFLLGENSVGEEKTLVVVRSWPDRIGGEECLDSPFMHSVGRGTALSRIYLKAPAIHGAKPRCVRAIKKNSQN